MICLTSKSSQKEFPKWLEFLYGLHQAQTLTSLIRKQIQLPIQILVRFKDPIKEKWNKISEESICKACKSFRRRADAIIEKNGSHIK